MFKTKNILKNQYHFGHLCECQFALLNFSVVNLFKSLMLG